MTSSIDYYDHHASQYASATASVDFHVLQDKFLTFLPENRFSQSISILDLGCGSGRDAVYFLKKGYAVDAIDGSEEMCRIAEKILSENGWQKHVDCMLFQNLRGKRHGRYDGVWACASLLHLSEQELPGVLSDIVKALKPGGILYASFKYGETERVLGERLFNDMTEERFGAMLQIAGQILSDDESGIRTELIETGMSFDVRPGRENEQWLNIFLRRIN